MLASSGFYDYLCRYAVDTLGTTMKIMIPPSNRILLDRVYAHALIPPRFRVVETIAATSTPLRVYAHQLILILTCCLLHL